MTRLAEVRAAAMAALRPPPRLPLADWIEANVYLPAAESALPGRMRLWAPQRGICEAIDDPAIERITIIKSARVGYTALLNAVVASTVANTPSPILALQPNASDARDHAVAIESMFEASPMLRGLLADEADESGRSTLLHKRFPGGSLKFLAAASPRNLRRHTARALLMDELDGYEASVEGDPVTLAERRTLTFRDRKILAGSTPVFDTGPISRRFAQSDQRVFEVCCPSCSEFSEVRWPDIRWPDGEPGAAYWACPANGCVIEELHKPSMVAAGRWRATRPEVKGHAGFRWNALISTHYNARWGALAAEFLAAKATPETLQVFTNTILGEPWRVDSDDLDDDALSALREPFDLDDGLPEDVLFLTVGVDCQDDRLEAVLIGHGTTALYVLRHVVFYGPIDSETPWRELDDLLRRTWPHPLGGTLKVDAVAVDAGDGGHMDTVTDFCRNRLGRRIVPIKGVPGFARPHLKKSESGGLWLVGVDAVKSGLFARLTRTQEASRPADRPIRFSRSLEPVYFEQLVSERRVMRMRHGRPTPCFERIKGRRAETLDATVYAWAVRNMIQISEDGRRAELSSPGAVPAKPLIHQSKWLSR